VDATLITTDTEQERRDAVVAATILGGGFVIHARTRESPLCVRCGTEATIRSQNAWLSNANPAVLTSMFDLAGWCYCDGSDSGSPGTTGGAR